MQHNTMVCSNICAMSSREVHKTAVRMARIQSQHQAARQRRLRSLLVVLVFAAATVQHNDELRTSKSLGVGWVGGKGEAGGGARGIDGGSYASSYDVV